MRTWIAVGVAAVVVIAAGNQNLGGAPSAGIALTSIGVYETGFFDEGAVEISAYDPESKRVFFTYAEQARIGIVDLSDPENPADAGDISLATWGAEAHATSVAVHNGIVAVAVPQGGRIRVILARRCSLTPRPGRSSTRSPWATCPT